MQLRSQLEPWGTTALRRRLVADFGEPPTDPDKAIGGRAIRKTREPGSIAGTVHAGTRSRWWYQVVVPGGGAQAYEGAPRIAEAWMGRCPTPTI